MVLEFIEGVANDECAEAGKTIPSPTSQSDDFDAPKRRTRRLKRRAC
jgi:hypothetical protein